MKSLLLASLLSVSCLAANAQHIDAGIHGGYGTTWFLNNNVSDQGDELDYEASFGPLIGLHGGYFFESNFGVVVEIDMAMNQQRYKGETTIGTTTLKSTAKDKVNYIEIPILLRKVSKSGFYFEVGPKFSFLSGAKETVTSSPTSPADYTDRDVAEGYKTTIVSAAFGIGGQFKLAENIYADLGLRFGYGFTDATKEFPETDLTKAALDEKIGVGTYNAHYDQKGKYSYKATHLATGHVLVGVTYRIPMAKKTATKK